MTPIIEVKQEICTVIWRQNPVLLILFQMGNSEEHKKSWKIFAYVHDIFDTFGQSIGSSTAVTPSLHSQISK
jgi:hypothetical protein